MQIKCLARDEPTINGAISIIFSALPSRKSRRHLLNFSLGDFPELQKFKPSTVVLEVLVVNVLARNSAKPESKLTLRIALRIFHRT